MEDDLLFDHLIRMSTIDCLWKNYNIFTSSDSNDADFVECLQVIAGRSKRPARHYNISLKMPFLLLCYSKKLVCNKPTIQLQHNEIQQFMAYADCRVKNAMYLLCALCTNSSKIKTSDSALCIRCYFF